MSVLFRISFSEYEMSVVPEKNFKRTVDERPLPWTSLPGTPLPEPLLWLIKAAKKLMKVLEGKHI
jgi:hypothetical protein